MNRIYISLVFLLVISFTVSGQTPNDSTVQASESITKNENKELNFPHLFWGFGGEIGPFGLLHDNKNVNMQNDLSYGGGIYFELQINKWLSTELGGYYKLISGVAEIQQYQNSFSATDDLNISYSHIINAENINEEMNADIIEIPVSIKFLWNPGNWNFYVKPGVSYTMVINSKYTQTANIGISGYYPNNNITFDNLPQHGYFTQQKFNSSGELPLKNGINPFIGAGVIIAGKGKSGVLFLEGKYFPGIIDFSDGKGNGTLFEGPMDNRLIDDYNFESITEEGKISLGGFVFNVGFRF